MPLITIAGHLTIDEVVSKDFSHRCMGGVSCYAALAARLLGAEVNVISKIGVDFPKEYLQLLRSAGVNISGVSIEPESKSTFFQITYFDDERRLRLLSRAGDLSIIDLEGDAIYLGPVAWEINLDEIGELAKKHERVMLDPQGLMRITDENGFILLKRLDLKFPKLWSLRISKEEARLLAQASGVEEMLNRLESIGAEVLILTLGKDGAIVSHREKRIKVPCFEALEKDPTGAGDVFGGAFIAEYLDSGDVEWAAAMGSAAASIVVEERGFYPLLARSAKKEVGRRAEIVYELIEKI